AMSLLENGVATREGIDSACKLGLNHPMGPLELADLIGNDIVLNMADGIYETLQEHRYIAPNLLRRMVAAGWLGQKSGKGFYDYNKK
ncbi:3-hydroxyacyl-CoA dehydrogenase family protein, partial [Chloroflexota bacterium]